MGCVSLCYSDIRFSLKIAYEVRVVKDDIKSLFARLVETRMTPNVELR
jgi:hypothetical protein